MAEEEFTVIINELRESGFPYCLSNLVPWWFLFMVDLDEYVVEFNRIITLAFLERQFDNQVVEISEAELVGDLLQYKEVVQDRMEIEIVQRECTQCTFEPFDIFSAETIQLKVAGHRWGDGETSLQQSTEK